MTLARYARVLLALAVAAASLTLPAPHADAKKKPVVIEVPPPPPPPPPPVTLSERLIADAANYEAYIQKTGTISPAFIDGPGVAAALKVGSSYEAKSLLRGAVAYGAIAALQDRTFVETVRSYGTTAQNRHELMRQIFSNSGYAVSLKGGASAAGFAKQAIGTGALGLFYSGRRVKQAAYDVQRQPWSKDEVAGRIERLLAVKSLSTMTQSAPADRVLVMRSTVQGLGPLTPPASPANPPYTPLVANAVSLAALAAIGEATEANLAQTSFLTDEVNTGNCLNMAKLNLYQCLAVAKPHYEDVFCLGQHAMIDTGACLAKFSGAVLPFEAYPKPLKIPPPKAPAKPRPKKRK
jgi:hypothetical protein